MTNEKICVLTKNRILYLYRDLDYIVDGKDIYCLDLIDNGYNKPLVSYDTEEQAKNALVGFFNALKSGDNYYSFIAE